MRPASIIICVLSCLALIGGCAPNGHLLKGQVQTLQQQQTTLAQRNDELLARAGSLDRNNQELEALLAQERQQRRVAEDQLTAMRDQLSTANGQLARARTDLDQTSKKTEALEASVRRQVGASIKPNSSLKSSLPPINIQGVQVRQDGDVVRIELPGRRLFEPGGARLTPEGARLIDDVIGQVAQTYPSQLIGIEGHTSNDPIPAGRWSGPHQLSVGMAMAAYDQVASKGRIPAAQMFVVGHGSNHPVASSATDAGRDRNFRVEIVVYPERPSGT